MRGSMLRRALLALAFSAVAALAITTALADRRLERTAARLHDAAEQLDSLTDGSPLDDTRRAAIAWGYAERLRLGLESPFRLVESAARDTRITPEERRTISWALLSRIVRGESHQVDPAVLDRLGGPDGRGSVPGEEHIAIITDAIVHMANPRAGELAVRFAYALAQAEGLVGYAGATTVAEVAALVADREIARREAIRIIRTARTDPIEEVSERRARRLLYVERPALLYPDAELEQAAIRLVPTVVASLRELGGPVTGPAADTVTVSEAEQRFAVELRRTGAQLPPAPALAVTVQRYLPMLRAHASVVDTGALRRAVHGEGLVGAVAAPHAGRDARRALGRLVVAAAVSMRSSAQDIVPFAADTSLVAARLALELGLSSIDFDREVPAAWRPYLLTSLSQGVRDLRRVFPAFSLRDVNVRFRMAAPADSALAMHDPRSRTLHLPAITAGGTLVHELAHELDRQSAVQAGLAGYRSDAEARRSARGAGSPGARVAASLRALAEEGIALPRATKSAADRPAEIFATRVDWFVAQALARQGVSSGFLSGVQDELLTGHVVHPERLRSASGSRSLLDALEGMTTVSAPARAVPDPGIHTLLRWSLSAPVDRGMAARILRGDVPWMQALAARSSCGSAMADDGTRSALLRLAAESRARGWLRQRARGMPEGDRPAWARGLLGQAPWAAARADQRVTELSDHILLQLASGAELASGLAAYAAPLAADARCPSSD